LFVFWARSANPVSEYLQKYKGNSKMNHPQYPIGTPGKKWGEAEKAEWLSHQTIKRSYADEVLAKLPQLKEHFEIEQYGALSHDPERYPLFLAKSKSWDSGKPVALITGGVHGYETSGVQGAIRFAATRARDFTDSFNVLVAPCVSPWAYETINRWNPLAIDPNRSFKAESGCEEALSLMAFVEQLTAMIHVHIDLHETTDTDLSEFIPALAARDATEQQRFTIPDGFYLVGDAERPAPEFQSAIITAVERVTHIAPPEENGTLIGDKLEQRGVVNFKARASALCMVMTEAPYVTTTEVYPDSPKVDDENCIQAQVAAAAAGLQFVLSTFRKAD